MQLPSPLGQSPSLPQSPPSAGTSFWPPLAGEIGVTDRSYVPGDVRRYGGVPGAALNNTTPLTSAIASAAAVGLGRVHVPPGVWTVDPFSVPENIVLEGDSLGVSVLACRDLTGAVFIYLQGSNSGVRKMTVDGRRALRPSNASGTIVAARQNGTIADGSSQSGGVKLSAGFAAGAASLTLLALPVFNILPGDTITLVEGANIENLVVAFDYVPGSLVVGLKSPPINAFTTAANVTVALKNIVVEDCRILAAGFTALTYWHVNQGRISGNFIYDAADTSLDFSSGGNREVVVANNNVETNGRWGMAIDEQLPAVYGRTEQITVSANTFRILSGGTNPLGNALDGIFIGSVESITVTGNTVDIRQAGLSGIRALQFATQITIANNSIVGRSNVSTSIGIRVDALTTDAAAGADRRISIMGNTVRGTDSGINLQASITAVVVGNVVRDCGTGIQAQLHGSLVQDIVVADNIVDGGTVGVIGINFTVPGPGAASRVRMGRNVVRNHSFLPVNIDLGWTVQNEDTYPARRSGVSANRGDANVALTPTDAPTQLFSTALTANRTVTLPTVGLYDGMCYRVVRSGLGAFTLSVGGLKVIPNATAAFVDVEYSAGAGWLLTGYGTL